jgi:DNA-binding GntR family transcriptional regulator
VADRTDPQADSGAAASERRLADYYVPGANRGATADAVTDALREAILDGMVPASSWLREVDIAAELNLSRTPVREAIRRLDAEGLVVHVPNQGGQVAPMGLDDILAVYTVRENLEGLAARLAAQRVQAGSGQSLTAAHRALKAAAQRGDVADMKLQNLHFHRAIRDAADNPYLQRFLTLVEHSVRRFGTTTFESPERMEATVVEHEAMLNAILNGNADEAESLAREHMSAARRAPVAMFLRTDS